MRYGRLGKTNLEVSRIAFGTWALGGEWGAFDAKEAKGAIHRALDLGITLFDTAQAYGLGASERLPACPASTTVARIPCATSSSGARTGW